MSLIPFFGSRRGLLDDDWGLAPVRSGDPFADINQAVRDMDNAIRLMNREMNRLSRSSGLSNIGDIGPLRPDIVDENGQKKIQYNFNVSGFKPEAIKLTTRDGRLEVSASQVKEDADSRFVREFHRMVALPEGVKLEDLKSMLRPDGILQVEALYNPPALTNEVQGREIPITHEPKKVAQQETSGGRLTQAA